jgi:hypothetical protein
MEKIFQNLNSETIIFGGLTLVAIALVYAFYKVVRQFGNHYTSIIKQNTEAWNTHSKMAQKQADSIDHLADTIALFSTGSPRKKGK